MKRTHILLVLVAALILAASFPLTAAEDTAVLAGGCFWGMEGLFEHVEGVSAVVSGYSGGDANVANYRAVSSGTTGHAETVRITFDPDVVSYSQLLEIFFTVAHDPTQLNYQGPDHGTQYRSVIFYQNDQQKQTAEEVIKDIASRHLYRGRIVTQVVPFKAFYPAESYHQDFMRRNPNYPYIVYWDWQKVDHLKEAFPALYVDKGWR